jgi:hypothetical protein
MLNLTNYLKKGFKFVLVTFVLFVTLLSVNGCKFSPSKTKHIVYEKKTTTIALVNKDEIQKYPQSDLKLAFLNDDRTYIVATIDENYDVFKTLLLSRPNENTFYDVFLCKGEVMFIEEIPKEEQEKLQNQQESSLATNRLSFKKDIRKNPFFLKKLEHPFPIEIEQNLTLKEINELYHVCDTLLTFNVKSSPIRSGIIASNLHQLKGLESYKLLLLPKSVNKVLRIAKKDSHMPEHYNWVIINVYKNINSKGDLIWYAIDPYLFNEPKTVNEILKQYEESSEVKIKSYILSPNAYGFDYLNQTALYEI